MEWIFNLVKLNSYGIGYYDRMSRKPTNFSRGMNAIFINFFY